MAVLACIIDPLAHDAQTRLATGLPALGGEGRDDWARDIRAMHHALAEQDIPTVLVDPVERLGAQMVGAARARPGPRRMTTSDGRDHAAAAVRAGRAAVAGPRQGWSSLVLLLVMLAVTGLAIDEQRWMGTGPDGASQTGMLPLLMVAAGITGAILAWSRLSAGWVDLVAALVGTGAGLLLRCGRGLGRALAGGPAGGAQRVARPVPARRPRERRAGPRSRRRSC